MSQIQFNADRHEYSVNGVVYPSVTQVLKIAGLIDTTWFTDEARERGSYVAQATHMLDEGTLDESSLDPALVPYVEAWKKFLADSKAEVIASEYAVVNTTYGYAGTLDRWLILNRHDTIIDIKGGQPLPWHPIQTAAYAGCLKTHFQRGSVYLRDNGTYRLKMHNDENDRAVWMAALVIAKWKQSKGNK
jgi:hypothetical protein